jgi:hypothetical protein
MLNGYYKNNSHIAPCEKEVFVNRTLNKWFKNKYIIWYRKSEQTDLYYKCYISISNINFFLGYGNELDIYFFDYSKPMDIFNNVRLTHNDVLSLEGEWCKTSNKHNNLLKLTYLNIPEKEYIFKAFDLDKIPKRKKKGWTNKDVYNFIETTVSFKAKTLMDAYSLKKQFEENQKGNLLISSEILEIK